MWIFLLRDMAAGTPDAGGIPPRRFRGSLSSGGSWVVDSPTEPRFPQTSTPLIVTCGILEDRDRPWGPHARISPTTLINAGRRASDLIG